MDDVVEIMARAAVESTSGPWDMLSVEAQLAARREQTAALAAIQAAGFQIVPVEPTPEMTREGALAVAEIPPMRNRDQAIAGYRAMLTAAKQTGE